MIIYSLKIKSYIISPPQPSLNETYTTVKVLAHTVRNSKFIIRFGLSLFTHRVVTIEKVYVANAIQYEQLKGWRMHYDPKQGVTSLRLGYCILSNITLF